MKFPVVLSLACCMPGFATLSERTRNSIDQITGAKGVYTAAEDVHKVSFPRNDVKVTVDRWPMQPFMGLTSWAAFTTGLRKSPWSWGITV